LLVFITQIYHDARSIECEIWEKEVNRAIERRNLTSNDAVNRKLWQL